MYGVGRVVRISKTFRQQLVTVYNVVLTIF